MTNITVPYPTSFFIVIFWNSSLRLFNFFFLRCFSVSSLFLIYIYCFSFANFFFVFISFSSFLISAVVFWWALKVLEKEERKHQTERHRAYNYKQEKNETQYFIFYAGQAYSFLLQENSFTNRPITNMWIKHFLIRKLIICETNKLDICTNDLSINFSTVTPKWLSQAWIYITISAIKLNLCEYLCPIFEWQKKFCIKFMSS